VTATRVTPKLDMQASCPPPLHCQKCDVRIATERQLLRRIYDLERQLLERNFAKGHSFEEWLEH